MHDTADSKLRPSAVDEVLQNPVAPGVTVTGFFNAELGIGESARLVLAAVRETGEPCATRLFTGTRSRMNHPWNDPAAGGYAQGWDTNILCMNADSLLNFYAEAGAEFFGRRYNIGVWYWEVDAIPQEFFRAFDLVHEIWVASDFVREAVARVSTKPVFTIPLPLRVPDAPLDAGIRRRLRIPEGFLFLFTFDFFSSFKRKNPLAVIEAFKRAFAPDEGPLLLIKSINGDKNLPELEALRGAAKDRGDILLYDGYLSDSEKSALTAACDCYVSLHRSEGFGLTMAEAMSLGKPVIATRYSGNLAFMNDANSFLCGYDMERVGDDLIYPGRARWASPRTDEAAKLMRFVHDHPGEAARRGRQAREDTCRMGDAKRAAAFIQGRLAELRRHPPPAVDPAQTMNHRPLAALETATSQRADIRKIVPPLMTWLLQGPRRAMKRLLADYEEHHHKVRHSTEAAIKSLEYRLSQCEMYIRSLENQCDDLESKISKSPGQPADRHSNNGLPHDETRPPE